MTTKMLVYLFQVMIIFSVLYMVYQWMFSKLTFHVLNRNILLAIVPLSLFIPLLTQLVPPIVYPIEEIPQLFEHITSITTTQVAPSIDQTLTAAPFNYLALLKVIYFLGVGMCVFRFAMSIYRLCILKKQSTPINSQGQVLYEAPISDVFSYFHWIFLPQGVVYDPLIIMHEKAHGQLRHTIDILLIELYIAFFWWNPLVYVYRKALTSVHEYQADQYVLQEDVKTSDYLQLIATSLEIKKPHQLYSYFNTPILKKRIDMMTKKTSHHRSKLTYFLVLPMCALFLIAFTKPIIENSIVHDVVQKIENIDVIQEIASTDGVPSFAFPVEGSSKQQITSFFNVNRKNPITKKSKIHSGIDIRAALGTPVIATADGTVFLSREVGAWGNIIKIKHQDDYETWYAHLKSFNTNYGKSVKKGDVIGYVGSTGNSTGPHLHYELKHYKKSMDPLPYFDQ